MFNPVIIFAVIIQVVISKFSRIAGAIIGYLITTGILLWGLLLYGEGNQIAYFGIPLSEPIFLILCLVWYGFDTKGFLSARKGVTNVNQSETGREPNKNNLAAVEKLPQPDTKVVVDEFTDKIAVLTKTIQAEPFNAKAYNQRGFLYVKRKDYPSALSDYLRSIELEPYDDNVAYNIACIYAKQYQTKNACNWLRRAIQISPENLELIKTDTDFNSIRYTPEYKALLSDFNKR